MRTICEVASFKSPFLAFLQVAGLVMGSQVSAVTKAVVQALAAGTFFHVTFVKVLPRELNRQQDRILKISCMIVGFALIATANLASSTLTPVHGSRLSVALQCSHGDLDDALFGLVAPNKAAGVDEDAVVNPGCL